MQLLFYDFSGFNQISQPKLPCFERKPLQGLVNQPIPSTSTGIYIMIFILFF